MPKEGPVFTLFHHPYPKIGRNKVWEDNVSHASRAIF